MCGRSTGHFTAASSARVENPCHGRRTSWQGFSTRACGVERRTTMQLPKNRAWVFALLASIAAAEARAEAPKDLREFVEKQYPSLESYYTALHRAPELSLMEVKTSQRLAEELRSAGYEVATNVGGHGVVAVLKNGPGKTLLIRTDLDALPVK